MSKPGQLADNEVYLGTYFLDRLAQLGVRCLFGVPGDVSSSSLLALQLDEATLG